MSSNKPALPGMAAGRPSKTRDATPANVFAEKEKTVRVNFDVSREEHIKLKVYAARSGRTIADVLREFVAQLSD